MRDEKMKREESQEYIGLKKEKLKRRKRKRRQSMCLEESEAERREKGSALFITPSN